MLIGGSQCELPYHAGAELLQEARPLRARQAGGGSTRANAAHARTKQEGHTAARVGHTATLAHKDKTLLFKDIYIYIYLTTIKTNVFYKQKDLQSKNCIK